MGILYLINGMSSVTGGGNRLIDRHTRELEIEMKFTCFKQDFTLTFVIAETSLNTLLILDRLRRLASAPSILSATNPSTDLRLL